MNQPAKAQEPSMEEILASIRRIIADDDKAAPTKPVEAVKPAETVPLKPAPKPMLQAVASTPAPAPKPIPPAAPKPAPAPVQSAPEPVAKGPEPAPMSQADIDAMLSGFDNPEPAKAATDPDVLDLTEAMAATRFQTINSHSDVVFAEEEDPVPIAAAPEPPPVAAPAAPVPGLLSPTTSATVDNAFNQLAHTVLVHNARTLDDLVKEMLRPMLKSWLDDNLPNLVERLVRTEIERVSRGRG
jgi:cell pole-organizing protein PopZ